MLLAAFRRNNVSEYGMDDILKTLAKMDEKRLVTVSAALPTTARTLARHDGAYGVSKAEADSRTKILFDTQDLLQTQRRVFMSKADLPRVVEELLSDTSIPCSDKYLEPGAPPLYALESGDRVYGPEIHQSKRARDLCSGMPAEKRPIFVMVWSDETDLYSGYVARASYPPATHPPA
jgi:hypothetical protein